MAVSLGPAIYVALGAASSVESPAGISEFSTDSVGACGEGVRDSGVNLR